MLPHSIKNYVKSSRVKEELGKAPHYWVDPLHGDKCSACGRPKADPVHNPITGKAFDSSKRARLHRALDAVMDARGR